MRWIIISLSITLLSLSLYGCGTKGPLYIPEQQYPQQTAK